MKTIIVTGGAGFLGTNLCLKLIDEKLKPQDLLIILDNFQTGKMSNIKIIDEKSKTKSIKMQTYFWDVKSDIYEFMLNVQYLNVVEVYHLACPASPPKYQQNAVDTMMTNVLGTNNIIKLALYLKSKLFFSSTSEVYGDPLESPQREEYRGNVSSIGPRSCYDEGKRAAESLCYDFKRQYGLDVRVARIFNTYGPYMDLDDGRVVTNFTKQAVLNNDITIYGDGSQTRSICFVDDLIAGFIKLMDSDEERAKNAPINLGNPGELTVKELAQEIIDLTKSDSKLIYLPLPEDDPKQRCPDITTAKEILNWSPKISRKQGLEKMIKYVREELV